MIMQLYYMIIQKGDNNMDSDEIICSCLDITKGMIQEAVNSGATSLEEVQAINSVGTICGACIEDVEQLIADLTAH